MGRGEESVDWFAKIFAGKDRKLAGVKAESQGLYFVGVRYDHKFGLPEAVEAFPYPVAGK